MRDSFSEGPGIRVPLPFDEIAGISTTPLLFDIGREGTSPVRPHDLVLVANLRAQLLACSFAALTAAHDRVFPTSPKTHRFAIQQTSSPL